MAMINHPIAVTDSDAALVHKRPSRGARIGFRLLLLCWFVLMFWPCLTQSNTAISRVDNVIMTLMAAVILIATHTALQTNDRFHAGLFAGAELLYCGAY